ncbi:hypothetical protein [Flavobacterium sp. PL02]|jgi:uncharacterized protein YkvS|uniref:hypothetical protein n=1 Tax=Flavobacterium sp. PL02 TaxID=3088354 RepID=UPI002B2308FC|nr:hypothetical protein [Flavobacterium sp. PL02]MEA9413736.1 hypothetical protein [Flavobacterium sp. PL02]
MKKIVTTLMLATLLVACGQEKQPINTKIMNIQYPEINANNFEQKLAASVKHYEKEPMYYMRINKSNCVVEVLVNDYRMHRDYELSNYATPLEINDAILKSGEQTVTYRLYPVGDLIKEEYGEGGTVTKLTDNTAISISIIKMDNGSEKTLEDEEVIMKHVSLTDAKGRFIASGKPYYEFTFSFNAQVPYVNEGWSKGQDLSKLDQKLLEAKAVEFYKEYGKIFENKDADLLAKLNFGEEKRNSIALYKKISNIDTLWKEYLGGFDKNSMKIQPIENYRMVFFGNDKIVFLQLNSLEYPYRGSGALRIDYVNKRNNEAVFMPGIYLYLPEGEKLEDGLYTIN